MTVGAIQFDAIFSAADSLRVVDVSGLAPLSFNPPSPEAFGRFLSSMSDSKPKVDSIRLALGSISQNLSSSNDVSRPVVASAQVVETVVAERPAVKAPVVELPPDSCRSTLAVEKPVVEAPVAPAAPAMAATSTAPVAQGVEMLVIEKPVVEKPVVDAPLAATIAEVTPGPRPAIIAEVPVVKAPVAQVVVEKPDIAPAAPATPTAPVAQVVETRVAEKAVVEAPAAPATPTAPVAQVVETLVVEKTVVEAPVVPAVPTAPVAQVVEQLVVEKPVAKAPVAPPAPTLVGASRHSLRSASLLPDGSQKKPTGGGYLRDARLTQVVETLVVEKPVIAPAVPTTPTAPVSHVVETLVVEKPVIAPAVPTTPTAPVAQVVETVVGERPVVEAPVAKPEVASAKPVVADKRTAAPEEVVVIDLSQESARAAAPLSNAPSVAAAQQEIAASTASARTESIIEVVNYVAEAIADQILVTPSLVRGEGQMIVRLKPEVLDGSEIRLSSESGTLAVEIVPSTPNAAKLATEAMPRLETALAEHVATFRQVSVSVRKGKGNEVV